MMSSARFSMRSVFRELKKLRVGAGMLTAETAKAWHPWVRISWFFRESNARRKRRG